MLFLLSVSVIFCVMKLRSNWTFDWHDFADRLNLCFRLVICQRMTISQHRSNYDSYSHLHRHYIYTVHSVLPIFLVIYCMLDEILLADGRVVYMYLFRLELTSGLLLRFLQRCGGNVYWMTGRASGLHKFSHQQSPKVLLWTPEI